MVKEKIKSLFGLSLRSHPDRTKDSFAPGSRVIQAPFMDSGTFSTSNIYGHTEKLSFKQLRKKDLETQLRTLARISPEVSDAISIYKGFVNSSWTLNADSDRSETTIQNWLEMQSKKGVHLNTLINQNIFDLYVLGGMALNVKFINETPVFLENIPPGQIKFLYMVDPAHPEAGKIWFTGIYINNSRHFVVLESLFDETPFFYYGGMETTSDSKQGQSPIESVVNLAIAAGEKTYLENEYLRGAIFPHEIYSLVLDNFFDLVTSEKSALTLDEVSEAKDAAIKELADFFSDTDSTQTLILDVPITKTIAGTLEAQNLRGLSDINDSHNLTFPRALKIPPTLFGTQNRALLNDTQSTSGVRAFYNTIQNMRGIIEKGYTEIFTAYLNWENGGGEAGVKFDDTDSEIKRLLALALKEESQAAKMHIDMGTFSRQEMRTAFVQGALDFTQFDPELPPDAMPTPQISQPMATSTEEKEETDA